MSNTLLNQLRRAGTLDSVGEFTIDAEKARSKMARFGLTEPRRYVLELIGAAVALGAPDVRLDSSLGLEMRFGGGPLPAAGLRDLDCYLLGGGESAEERALSALAVGLNALRQLRPLKVVVETPEGLRMIREDGSEAFEACQVPEHRIQVHWRGGWKLTELELVRTEGAYALCPLRLDGQELAPPPLDLWMEVEARRGSQRFRLGLDRLLSGSALTLVADGVVVGRKLPELELPLRGIVWDDGLRRNASRSDVVEDARYEELLRDAVEVGHQAAVRLAAGYPGEVPRDVQARARELLLCLAQQHRAQDPLGQALSRCPLIPTLSGETVSLADLSELEEVPACDRKLTGIAPGQRVVHTQETLVKSLLATVFGPRLVDVESRLLQEIQAQGNRERWVARPRPADLPPGPWLARGRLETPEYRGEIGIDPRDSGTGSILHLLYQGRLLGTRELANTLSYVAVLDFPELEILPDWSGPASSPLYRKALEHLDQVARGLYDGLDVEQLEAQEPGLRDHVLLRMLELARQRKPLPSMLRSARVFQEIRGGLVSLERLEGSGPLGLVDPAAPALPEDLPAELFPEHPVVRAGAAEQAILRHAFGKQRVKSFGARYAALRDLAERWGRREEPRLPARSRVVAFQEGSVVGELGLSLRARPGKAEVRVLRRGIPLGTRKLDTPGPFVQAVIDCADLTPNRDWRGFREDAAWQRARSALAAAERRAWLELVSGVLEPLGEPERAALLRLASHAPDLHPRLGELKLFRGVGGLCSAGELRSEMSRQGRVLVSPEPIESEQRVLLAPGPEELAALQALVPEIRTVEAAPLLAEARAREEFLGRKVRRLLSVPGRPLERQPLEPPLRGEVALLWSGGGWVEYFWEGRSVVRRPDLLPACFSAVVESPDYEPDRLFSAIVPGPALEEAGRQVAAAVKTIAGRFGALEQFRPGHLALVLEMLAWKHLDAEVRKVLDGAPCFPRLPQGRISLREIREATDRARSVPFVPAGVSGRPLAAPVVLVLPGELLAPVQQRLGKKLVDYTEQLAAEEAQRRRLAGRPVDLDRCLVRLSVKGAGLEGGLGIPARDGEAGLLFLREGEPVGALPAGELAAAARLEGDFRVNRQAEVLLTKAQSDLLRKCALEAYRLLAEQFNRLPASAQEPACRRLLEFLLSQRGQLGGTGPAAQVGELAVSLPLIPTTAGERVSVQALVEETQQKGALLYADGRFRLLQPERLLPVLPEASVEYELCLEMLGKKSLQRWKPQLLPRVDATAVTARLGTAWRWGWSQVQTAATAVGQSLGSAGSRVVELVPSLPEQEAARPEETAEVRLLHAVRREFQVLVRGRLASRSGDYFKELSWTRWALGPAVLWRSERLTLNGLHPAIRHVRDHFERDPACLVLLVVHILCQVNHALESVTDRDEFLFLESLAETMRGAFPAE